MRIPPMPWEDCSSRPDLGKWGAPDLKRGFGPANSRAVDASGTGWSLRAFLGLVIVLLAWGLGRQLGSPGFDEALAQILEGDLDREERLAALRVLRDSDVEGPERTLIAATAALLLHDRKAFDLAAGQLPSLLVGDLTAAELGEPCLRSLLAALSAESRGNFDEAGDLYSQAKLSAGLWKVPLVEQLAEEGLQRVR